MKIRILKLASAAVLLTFLASMLSAAVPPTVQAQEPEQQAAEPVVLDTTDSQAREAALADLQVAGVNLADIGILGGSPEYVFADGFNVAPADKKVPLGWTQFGSTVGRDNWAEYFSSDGPGSVIMGTTPGDYDVLYHGVSVPAAKWNASIDAEATVLVKFRILSGTKTKLHFYFQTKTGDARELGSLDTTNYSAGSWQMVQLPYVNLESYLARNKGITRFFMTGWGDGSPVYIDQVGVLVILKTYRWEIDQRILRENDPPVYGPTVGRWWVEDVYGPGDRFWCDVGRCTILVYAYRSLKGEGHPGDTIYRVSRFSLPAMPPEENLELSDYFVLPAIRLDEFNSPPSLEAVKAYLEAQLAALPDDGIQTQDTDPRVYLPIIMRNPPPEWPKCVGSKCWDSQQELFTDMQATGSDQELAKNILVDDGSALADEPAPPTREELKEALAYITALEAQGDIGTQKDAVFGSLYFLTAGDKLYQSPNPATFCGVVTGSILLVRLIMAREPYSQGGQTVFFWPHVFILGSGVDLATYLLKGRPYWGLTHVLFHGKQRMNKRMFMSDEELVELYLELTKADLEWRDSLLKMGDQEYTGWEAVGEVGLLTYVIYVVVPKLAPETAPLFILELHGFGGLGISYDPPLQS